MRQRPLSVRTSAGRSTENASQRSLSSVADRLEALAVLGAGDDRLRDIVGGVPEAVGEVDRAVNVERSARRAGPALLAGAGSRDRDDGFAHPRERERAHSGTTATPISSTFASGSISAETPTRAIAG